MKLKKKKVLKYVLLPEVFPRFKGLFASGFSYMASLLAVIYSNTGLIPSGHPYLKAQNFGKFGIRHVVAEASNNLVISRKNVDQILMHGVIICGLVMLIVQVCLLVVSFLSVPAIAGTFTATFVNTPYGPDQDIAFYVLDRVFGVMNFTGTAGFFESCYSTSFACTDIRGNPVTTPGAFPGSFHRALHQLFLFYTLGIAYFAMMIIIYWVIAIIGETITSGRPFGQRTNKAWFIPRLIVFFALIAPMNMGPGGQNVGINAAQYITLGVAKFGSNMATNAWDQFHTDAIAGNPALNTIAGEAQTLIAIPNAPELGTLTQFLFVARLCMLAEKIVHNRDLHVYAVREDNPDWNDGVWGGPFAHMNVGGIDYFNVMTPMWTDPAHPNAVGGIPSFDEVLRFSRFGTVTIRFGEFNPPGSGAGNPPGAYLDELGYVKPVCGELTLVPSAPLPDQAAGDPVVTGFATTIGNFQINVHALRPDTGAPFAPGPYGLQENYFYLIEQYFLQDPYFDEMAGCILKSILPYDHDSACIDVGFTSATPAGWPNSRWGSRDAVNQNIEYYNNTIKAVITGIWYQPNAADSVATVVDAPGGAGWNYDPDNFIDEMRLKYDFEINPLVLERGWVGAALWYHEIAQINGMFMTAVQNVPQPTKYPEIMEMISDQQRAIASNPSWSDRFNPLLGNGQLADLPRPGDQYIAAALYSGFKKWGDKGAQASVHNRKSDNGVVDIINMIFGTEGLYDLLESKANNVHPFAALSALGKGMIDASVRNLLIGVVGQGVGEILSDSFIGTLGKAASDVAVKFALMGLSVGFVLYYVFPLMPFVYFFFAFSGWVKSIFEAVVAMPLWAVAHIKIDGEGLPGPWATNGYFLLFEIFLRPTLIIFGLLASFLIFTALVNAVNDSFHLVVFNATGFELEQHFYLNDNFGNYGNLPMSNVGTTTDITLAPSNPGAQDMIDFIRGPLDEFFYTVIYAVIVYMIALSSFKLIDQIPNNILRWMGATVSTFQENAGDPASELSGKMYRSGNIVGSQLGQMIGYLRGSTGNPNATTDTLIQNQLSRGG